MITRMTNNNLQSTIYIVVLIIIVAKATVRIKDYTKPTNGVEYRLSSSSLHFTWPGTFVYEYFGVET